VQGGSRMSLNLIDPAVISEVTNRPEDLIYDLIHTQIKTEIPGAAVLLTFYLQSSAPEGYKGIGELRDFGI
jgi:hypothetical protein